MQRAFWAAALAALVAGTTASAHHSYAAYDRQQTIEVEGVLEAIRWAAPHVILSVRADDQRLYYGEWQAPQGLGRRNVDQETLQTGQRLVISGNPHREIGTNGIVNLRTVHRPADGWHWPAGAASPGAQSSAPALVPSGSNR